MFVIALYKDNDFIGFINDANTCAVRKYKHKYTAQRTINMLLTRYALKEGRELRIENARKAPNK